MAKSVETNAPSTGRAGDLRQYFMIEGVGDAAYFARGAADIAVR
jgi:hypothetical protein